MITFHVLGPPYVRAADGRPLASPVSGSKRLGLLAYLALGRGATRRDTLLALFWPESDERGARNSLSNMLHQVRRTLGAEVVITRGRDEVGLSDGAVWCDALAFERALGDGRLAEALELYRGDLLDGLFVSGASAEFDHWLDGERLRLRGRAADAALALYEAAEVAGDTAEALRWARWSYALEPYGEGAARRLIRLLAATGERAGALRTYDEFAARLARELEAEPSAETRALMDEVRSRSRPDASPPAGQALHGFTSGGVGWEDAVRREGPLPVRTVAVLPFENVSGSTEAEPFALGLHDDLLTELSRMSGLSVIARASVAWYRETDRSLPTIARELGVGTIVQGGVRTAGGRLRLNVQVIDAGTGAHRWAERYDRELSAQSIFDLQGELAREIAQALETELTSGELQRPDHTGTEDLEAYRLCVQGRALLDQRTPGAMHRSVDYFQRAIERGSGYALAWSGLADALSLLEFYDHAAPASAPGPMEAALRAVELGPELGQAHASLGIIRSIRHQGGAALPDFETAIELAPSHAEAHAWLGWLRLLRGEPAEALVSSRRGVELDPLAPAFRAYLAEAYLACDMPAEALREAVRARRIQPEYGLAHFMEGLVLYHVGRLVEAEAALERALDLVPAWGMPRHAEVNAVLAVIAASSGNQASARARLARIDGAAHPFSRGLVLAALGDHDGAMDAFARVRNWGSFSVDHYRYFFPGELGALRQEPGFARLRVALDRTWCGASRE
jgi:TolB-like protein/DNA-binding SARP family transcriptional activator/Flp pilus assembly protein TadD